MEAKVTYDSLTMIHISAKSAARTWIDRPPCVVGRSTVHLQSAVDGGRFDQRTFTNRLPIEAKCLVQAMRLAGMSLLETLVGERARSTIYLSFAQWTGDMVSAVSHLAT